MKCNSLKIIFATIFALVLISSVEASSNLCKIRAKSIEDYTKEVAKKSKLVFDEILNKLITEEEKGRIAFLNTKKSRSIPLDETEIKELQALMVKIESGYASNRVEGIKIVVYVPEQPQQSAIDIIFKTPLVPTNATLNFQEDLSEYKVFLYHGSDEVIVFETDGGGNTLEDFIASIESYCESHSPPPVVPEINVNNSTQPKDVPRTEEHTATPSSSTVGQ